jgi:GT2 family glycosyltransferase
VKIAPPSLALAFATIERPQVAERLVRSVRKYFDDLPIYVADQSRQVTAIASFYEQYDVRLLRMPYDAGVTASRNRLAREIPEDYFVLCDDDFIFGPQTRFDDALQILATHPEIGVVGGKLYDYGWNEEWVRNWELFLEYDRQQKILFSIPIYELAPRAREVGGIRFFLCDAVLNFAVFRRSMFAEGMQWDERFKSNGEHEDFFLNLKLNSRFRVAYLPTMVAYHHHPEEYRAYISRLRERNEGWKRFFDKWGLEQHIEFGLGVRTLDDLGTVVEESEARARFFFNGDLSLRRTQPMPAALLIGDFEKIATVGALDGKGNRSTDNTTSGSLLLDPDTFAIIPAPDAKMAVRPGAAGTDPKDDDARERYRLEPSNRDQAVSATDQEIYFRHDAILRQDSDFYLWYYCDDTMMRQDAIGRRLAVVVRWSDCSGRILVWKSRRTFLDLRSTGYWRPLHVDVPLLPHGVTWLRFDLITDGGPSPDPLCTGFLFGGRATNLHHLDPSVFEVLGLSRLPNDGASPRENGKYLEEIGRACPVQRVTLRRSSIAADMMLFDRDQVPGLEALYFIGWKGLGRGLVGARLPKRAPNPPATLALPSTEWCSPSWRIYGYGGAIGFIRLAAETAASAGR